MATTFLCRGDSCPIKEECWRWDVNRGCPDTPEKCEGLAFFIKPPWGRDGCVEWIDRYWRDKEQDDGGC